MPVDMTYIVQRKDRFDVVAYDGLDPLTGKERRRWHPAGRDRHGHCCIEADGFRVVQARGSIRASGASPLIFHGGFQAVTLGPSDAGCWLARLNATVPC
jgi:hypothetical protein